MLDQAIMERFKDAVGYDGAMPKIFPGYALAPEVIASYLQGKVPVEAMVMDIGTGTATALLRYAELTKWTLHGIDPTQSLLDYGREKVNAAGLNERIELYQCTVDDVPASAMYDAVTIMLVEHLQPKEAKAALINGAAAHIKPGGFLVIAGLCGDFSTAETQRDLEAWLQHARLMGFPEPAVESFRHKATVEDSFSTAAKIVEMMTDAGCVGVSQVYQVQLYGIWIGQKA